MRMLLTLCYDGRAYHGWQVQKNALAVQPVVQDALAAIVGFRPALSGCSRTDSGVHALEYCCHFDLERPMDPALLVRGINAKLPRDIAAVRCRQVDDAFHARYSCTGKEYLYFIYNAKERSPFYEGRALHISRPLDASLLHHAAQGFVGRHDFAGFCSAGAKEGETVRTVYRAQVQREGDCVRFCVCADGFLYHMVRIMTGTLLHVAAGKIRPEEIGAVVDSCQRRRAGPTAPAHGLYLKRVYYDEI